VAKKTQALFYQAGKSPQLFLLSFIILMIKSSATSELNPAKKELTLPTSSKNANYLGNIRRENKHHFFQSLDSCQICIKLMVAINIS